MDDQEQNMLPYEAMDYQRQIQSALQGIGNLSKLGLTVKTSGDGLIGVFYKDTSPGRFTSELIASFDATRYKGEADFSMLKSTEGKQAILYPLAQIYSQKAIKTFDDPTELIRDRTIQSDLFGYALVVSALEQKIQAFEQGLANNDIAFNPTELVQMRGQHERLISFNDNERFLWFKELIGI